MTNYDKSINLLKELGAKKYLFYSIDLTPEKISLQGELTGDARQSMEQYVTFELHPTAQYIEGSTTIDGLELQVVLTF